MELTLTDIQCRILGCLIEKEITTPEYYPLSLNALTLACNQKSNRDPLMDVGESDVILALDPLKAKHVVWERRSQGSRVLKYEHNCIGLWRFSGAEIAVVAELLLRGPQTPGELRSRASRMHPYSDITEVDGALRSLITREGGPFIAELPLVPGTRELRFSHLFTGAVQPYLGATSSPPAKAHDTTPSQPGTAERLTKVESELAQLKAEVAALKTALGS